MGDDVFSGNLVREVGKMTTSPGVPYASKAYLKNSRCENPGFLTKTIFLMTSGSLRFGLEQGLGKT